MEIIEQTETKLILKLDGNHFLQLGLEVGGILVFIGFLMFMADFRTNPDYTHMSAQNLNFLIKILGGVLTLAGVSFAFAGINNQDKKYIFDRIKNSLIIEGKGLTGSFKKAYPLSSIKEVVVNQTASTPTNTIPDGYTKIPTSDLFYISLKLEDAAVAGLSLQYRSSDRLSIDSFANVIRQFLAN